MNKGIYLAAIAAIGVMLSMKSAVACDERGLTGIMPENDMRVSVFATTGINSMDEKNFNAIIDRVVEVYEPIIKDKGGILKVNRLWKNDTVNASANRSGKYWEVNMYGGLARHQAVTDDGFMLVVCHELGHHIGGAPKYAFGDWASNEGQADYFGTMKCMRRILQNDNNRSFMETQTVDPVAQATCDQIHRDSQERALCARIAMAGKSLSDLFASTGAKQGNFNTPDTTVVSRTNDNHPKPQCRLDTYFQGSLCTRSIQDDVSDSDARRGVCLKSDGFTAGMRPLCWYKPGTAE